MTSRDLSGRRHFVYRVYDGHGILLYIGVSKQPKGRFRWHKANSPWYAEAASCRMSGPYLRPIALEKEREAIRDEHPFFNAPLNSTPPTLVGAVVRSLKREGFPVDDAWLAMTELQLRTERVQSLTWAEFQQNDYWNHRRRHLVGGVA